MILQSKIAVDFQPHPEGIFPAVCVDVIDLGMVPQEYEGRRRSVRKVRIFFETEMRNAEGRNFIIAKNFTASLFPKSKLTEFLGNWRGRPVVPGDSIDLGKLPGTSCTIVLSHKMHPVFGNTYARVDAISRPTKRVIPSGQYDPVEARQKITEWNRERDSQQRQPAVAAGNIDDVGF